MDAEAAAALAQSLRWVIKGAWSPGSYEAGDVVVYDERAYYAQTATSVEPPAQPWVPLTPAGGGGASHWDDLDGKPTVFPPEAHTHDAEDVSGAATPLLDVTEASVGAQSVGEALDATTDASRLEGALTDQVDATQAMVGPTQNNPEPMSAAEWMDALESGIVTALDMVNSKSDADHTHDGADIAGTLTDQVDVSNGMVTFVQKEWDGSIVDTVTTPLGEYAESAFRHLAALKYSLSQAYNALDSKSNVGHTHTAAEVGLGNVDNTSDAAKPVSTATQAALDAKIQLVSDFPASPTPGVLYLKAE